MARKKNKMRTGKVKRVKKTHNSRRTKRNTRRRNTRKKNKGGGSLKEMYNKFKETNMYKISKFTSVRPIVPENLSKIDPQRTRRFFGSY